MRIAVFSIALVIIAMGVVAFVAPEWFHRTRCASAVA